MKRDRRLIAIALLFSLVAVNSCSQLFAMAAAEEVVGRAVVEEAAEEAFGTAGKAAMEGAEKAAMEEALGATFEDIGKLPESAQAALREKLVSSFKSFESAEELFTAEKMPDAFGRARTNFTERLTTEIGPREGFPSAAEDALTKFDVNVEKFPVVSAEEQAARVVDAAAEFEPAKVDLTPEETTVMDAEQSVADAQANLDYAQEQFDPETGAGKEKLDTAQKSFDEAKAKLESSQQALQEKLDARVQSAKGEVVKAEKGLADAQTGGSSAATNEARNALQSAQGDTNKAVEVTIKEERKAAIREFKDAGKGLEEAKAAKSGTAEDRAAFDKKQAELRKAKTPEERAKIEGELREMRENKLGAEGKSRQANFDAAEAKAKFGEESPEFEEAQAKVKEAKQALQEADDAEKLAQENYEAARKKALDAGEFGYFEKGRWQEYVARGKATIKEQIVMNIIAGFAFMIPNYVIGPIQAAMQAADQRTTLMMPQNFGNMWMQIPKDLISEPGEPVVAFFLYTGLHESPTDEGIKRDDTDYADANSYLKNAPLFMGRTEYDQYATAPITDPTFPDQMVNLDTGFQFFGDGRGIPGENVVPLLASPAPKPFKENLQYHLDKKAEDIARGVTSEVYFENRDQETGYPGSTTISNRLESIDQPPYDMQFSPIIREAVQVFNSGTMFGKFKVGAFQALGDATMKLIALEGQQPRSAAPEKPYVALRQYVYQTFDTPTIKSLNSILAQDPEKKDLVGKIPEYVLMGVKDDINPVSLQIPKGTGEYNFSSYQLNPKANQMLSLFNGTFYKKGGGSQKTPPLSAESLSKVIGTFSDLSNQIQGVNDFINSQLQYGPFVFGGVKLTVDKKLKDANVPVYKVPGFLEDGSDDYVVATKGMEFIALPGNPTNFISLVTARIYDNAFVPYDKEHGGRTSLSYTVYKITDEAPPVVASKSPSADATPITVGLKAPLYSLFMDPAVNPNTIDIKSVPKVEDQQWLKEKLGGIDFPLPVPAPPLWALSDRGPRIEVDNTTERIGKLIETKAPELETQIRKLHDSWIKTYSGLGSEKVERMLGLYNWVEEEVTPITLRASSAADVQNGNFVYVSPFYPNELLVLANDKQGAQGLGGEYNVTDPQPYAISLSSGKVYGRKENGELVGRVDNLEQLTKRVTDVQGAFLPALADKLKVAQSVQEAQEEVEQYGDDTAFGPFQFFIFKEDLESGQYIYADVTGMPKTDVLKKAKDGKLLDEVKDFYVAIQLKDGVTNNPDQEDNPALDFNNWKFGTKLGAKTFRVLNVVNGVLYDRGGGYQGYIKPFAESVDKNLDIQKGFLDIIFGLLKATWGEELRSALKAKIQKLTQSAYETFLAEKKEITEARQKEQGLYKPLDANLKANIDAQPYVEWLQSFSPQRYLKEYKGKYYGVSPDEPRVYVDFNIDNIDNSNPDNNIGMSYSSDGKALVRMQGWVLDNLRAYNGVIVNADGSQVLDVSVDHPSIPMANMVKLDVATLKQQLTDAQAAYAKASKAFADASDKTDKALKQQLLSAAANVGYAKQAYASAQVVDKLDKTVTKNLNFYFNRDIAAYFVEVGGERYIDLIAGYEYNPDGTPRLATRPVYVEKDNNNDLLFVGRDQHDLLTVIYQAKDPSDKKQYYKWTLFDDAMDATKQEQLKKYSLSNDLAYDLHLFHDTAKGNDEYRAYVQTLSDPEPIFTGSYNPDESLKFSLLRYFSSRSTGEAKGTFNKSDERLLDPVYIVWDGKPDLKLQKLYYQNELLALTSDGADSWSAQYTADDGQTRALKVEKKVQQHGKTSGHYITITDGKKSYDFLYDTSMLDPTLPVNCQSEDPDYTLLNYWKQCRWQVNVVVDGFGVTRLINTIPARMPGIPKEDLDRLTKQAGDRGAIVSDDVKAIKYDAADNRYLYKLTAAKDSQWTYFQPRWNNWYVDLSNGVLYTIDTTSAGEYPIGAMHPAQLYLLLDKLEVSVAPVPTDGGEPLFDASGNPVMEDGKQVTVKPGLVYRSKRVVNNEIQNLAETAKADQKR